MEVVLKQCTLTYLALGGASFSGRRAELSGPCRSPGNGFSGLAGPDVTKVSGVRRPLLAGCWTEFAAYGGLLGGLSGPDLAEVSGIGRPLRAGCWTELAAYGCLLGGLSGPDLAEVSGIGRPLRAGCWTELAALGGLSQPDVGPS